MSRVARIGASLAEPVMSAYHTSYIRVRVYVCSASRTNVAPAASSYMPAKRGSSTYMSPQAFHHLDRALPVAVGRGGTRDVAQPRDVPGSQ